MRDAEAELRALCDKYAQFSPEEWREDQQWLAARIDSGKLDGHPVAKLKGRIVAVYEKELALIGDDETAMRVELSGRYQVHPGRFVLLLLDDSNLPRKTLVLGCSVVNVALILALCAVVGIAAISSLGTKANLTFSKIGSSVGTPTSR
jgi:Flp pilus assembly pilin Flp